MLPSFAIDDLCAWQMTFSANAASSRDEGVFQLPGHDILFGTVAAAARQSPSSLRSKSFRFGWLDLAWATDGIPVTELADWGSLPSMATESL
jgi:hypothetical protein